MTKLNLTIVKPGKTIDDLRRAAIEMHTAIHGRPPTDDELRKLDATLDEYRKKSDETDS